MSCTRTVCRLDEFAGESRGSRAAKTASHIPGSRTASALPTSRRLQALSARTSARLVLNLTSMVDHWSLYKHKTIACNIVCSEFNSWLSINCKDKSCF